jgi:putative transposase
VSTEETEKVQAIVAEGVAREGLQEMVLPAEEAAAKRLAAFVSDAAVDRMMADAQDAGVSLLDGPGGLIGQLTARVIERALGAEMDDHLGYVKGDPAGNGTGNSRNGSFGKTVTTTSGPVRFSVGDPLRSRRLSGSAASARPRWRWPSWRRRCHRLARRRAW